MLKVSDIYVYIHMWLSGEFIWFSHLIYVLFLITNLNKSIDNPLFASIVPNFLPIFLQLFQRLETGILLALAHRSH